MDFTGWTTTRKLMLVLSIAALIGAVVGAIGVFSGAFERSGLVILILAALGGAGAGFYSMRNPRL